MTAVEAGPESTGPPRGRGVTVRRPGWRTPAYAGLLAAVVGLLLVATFDRGGLETEGERIERLQDSFACPICDGESVADSNTAVSSTIRQFIDDRVRAGASDREIRDALIASYDVDVLLNPPGEGFAGLVWVLPVVVGALAAVAGAYAMTRMSPAARAPDADDEALVAQARMAQDRMAQDRVAQDRMARDWAGKTSPAGGSE